MPIMSRRAKASREDSALFSAREPGGSRFAPRDFAEPSRQAAPEQTTGALFDNYLHQRRIADLAQSGGRSAGEPAAAPLGGEAAQRKNQTGMPDSLKSGVESLSGIALDDVKVHYNSPQPAKVQALAYTQGTDIHVAPGQEKHLPHEAWHAVQQKEQRVRPTGEVAGVALNDNQGLEKEADVMGAKASRLMV